MPPREEEEFELVLGNKQLLSLFFVVVVLFAIFFSFGYTLGFGRGQHDRVATIAETDTVPNESEGVRIPDALLKELMMLMPPLPSPDLLNQAMRMSPPDDAETGNNCTFSSSVTAVVCEPETVSGPPRVSGAVDDGSVMVWVNRFPA